MRSLLLFVLLSTSCALGPPAYDYGRPCEDDADCDALCLEAPSGERLCAPGKATELVEPSPLGPGIEGCLLLEDTITLAGTVDALTPRVAFNPTTLELGVLYAVHGAGGVREIFFRRIGFDGTARGETIQLTFGSSTPGAERFANPAPALAVNARTGQYAAAWSIYDVATGETTTELVTLRDDGEPDTGPVTVADHVVIGDALPELVASGEGFVLVLRDDEPDDLYAFLISGAGTISGRVGLGAAPQYSPLIALDVDEELGLVVAYLAIDGLRLWTDSFDVLVADDAVQRPRVVKTPGGLDVFYTFNEGLDARVGGKRVSRTGEVGPLDALPGTLGDASLVGDQSVVLIVEDAEQLAAHPFTGAFGASLSAPAPEPSFQRLAAAAVGDSLVFATEQYGAEHTRIDLGTLCVP